MDNLNSEESNKILNENINYWKGDQSWYKTLLGLLGVILFPIISIIWVKTIFKNITYTVKGFDLLSLLAYFIPILVIISILGVQ